MKSMALLQMVIRLRLIETKIATDDPPKQKKIEQLKLIKDGFIVQRTAGQLCLTPVTGINM